MIWSVLALFAAIVFCLAPIYPDPYYHKGKVSLPEWLYREFQELLHGEKARRIRK